jgi:hypothetical protein
MNELQIRLTADIKDLQSAINKAKATLKSFESETATDSEKSNVGFRRKIGLIEQLTVKAKALKVSLSQATNEKQIAAFNSELEQTNQELARLNALGKSFSAPAVKSFDNLKRSAGAASGAAISFGRIIQDAPFGIIGVANNIQNFGEQFVALGDKSTSTAGKLKLFFSALITPSNLAILAVSGLTAAWQAYNLGVFDSLFATESLSKKLKEISDNTKSATANASVELIKVENLKKTIEDETLSRDERFKAVKKLIELYPQIFSLGDKEKLLNGQLVKSYEILTQAIVAKAKASIAEQELPELVKQKEIVDSTLKSKEALLAVEKERLKTASRLTPIDQAFSGSDYEQIQRRIKPLKADVEELGLRQKELQINIDGYTQSVVSYSNQYEELIDKNINSTSELNTEVGKLKRTFESIIALPNGGLPRSGDVEALRRQFQRLQEGGRVGTTGEEFIQSSLQKVKDQGIITSLPTKEISDNFKELSNEIKFTVDDLAQAFTGLGSVIGRAFNNPQLGTFLGEFLRFASKLVAANFKIAGSNAVAGASQASLATGPAAPLTLPAFIAGALGVVAAAFAAFGNFGSSSSSSMSSGSGSTFTNRREFGGPVSKGRAYIVGERRPELFVPNTNGVIIPQLPSMDYSSASVNSGMYGVEVMLKGPDDLLFFVEQAQIRRNIR